MDFIHGDWTLEGASGNTEDHNAGIVNANMVHNGSPYCSNITFRDFRVDTSMGRAIGLNIMGDSVNGTIQDITLENWTIREKLKWCCTFSEEGQNYLVTETQGSEIKNIHFNKISYVGNDVSKNTDWNLVESGDISGVQYTS